MKERKINILQLIASLCLLFGCIINLVETFVELPFPLRILSVPLLIASIILYSIVYARKMKNTEDNKK